MTPPSGRGVVEPVVTGQTVAARWPCYPVNPVESGQELRSQNMCLISRFRAFTLIKWASGGTTNCRSLTPMLDGSWEPAPVFVQILYQRLDSGWCPLVRR